jgi:hypothetical protein
MLDLYWTTVGTYEPRQMYEAEPRPVERSEDTRVRITRRWRRLEEAIFEALAPFKEAADAVVRALAEVEPVPEGAG